VAARGLYALRVYHPPSGDAISQRIRKHIEEAFDWIKTVGDLRQRYRRRARVQMHAYLVGAAYNVLGIELLAQVSA
jgi:Transposase DDE domain